MPSGKLSIPENEGFLVYIEPDNSKFGTLEKCVVVLPGNHEIEIDVKSDVPIPIVTPSNEKIERFSKQYCGIRLKNLSKNSSGTFILFVQDTNRNEIKETFVVTVLEAKKLPQEINVTAAYGTSVRISCPGDRHCRILDKNGKKIYEDQTSCSTYVSFTNDNDQFYCKSLVYGKMSEETTKINILLSESKPGIQSNLTIGKNSAVLKCQNTQKVSVCIAERPDGQRFHIDDGLLTDFYSAYDTM